MQQQAMSQLLAYFLACNADVCVALRSYDPAQHAGGGCEGQSVGPRCCYV